VRVLVSLVMAAVVLVLELRSRDLALKAAEHSASC
jgi:hypothetical protein